MIRNIDCKLGVNVTGIGYQLFSATALIGSRVTTGITNPSTGIYIADGVDDTGARGVHWSNTAGDVFADEVFDGLSGPSSVTLTFNDASNSPVPLVDFTVIGQGPGRAGTDGIAAFGLEDGDYIITARPTNGTLFYDTALTVSGTTTTTITGTARQIPIPTDPGNTTAYLVTRNGFGLRMAHVPIDFQIILPVEVDSYGSEINTVKSGSTGDLFQELPQNTRYRSRRGPTGQWVEYTTGSDPTFQLPIILGTP